MEECRKKFPYLFLIIIVIIIIFIYFCIVKLLIFDVRPWSNPAIIAFLILYNLIFILLIWSMVQTIRTDPGRVPIQWVNQLIRRDLGCPILLVSIVSSVMFISHNVPIIVHPAVVAS